MHTVALRRWIGRPLKRTAQACLSLPDRIRDSRRPTYGNLQDARVYSAGRTQGPPIVSNESKQTLQGVVPLLMEHRFDLLGSGWVRAAYGAECSGLEDHRFASAAVTPDRRGEWLKGRINGGNLMRAQRIWKLVISGYEPIDWQRDFKSGYRWREATWYRDIKFGDIRGADVKVPWELARMQHLPLLAWAYSEAKSDAKWTDCAREFCDEILDFVATNPPRYGVNWACPMDVAIRVANWLITHDLFRSFGAEFDPEFERVFANSVYDHAAHVVSHPETKPFRGNHYLAGIAGLLVAASHLRTHRSEEWLTFANSELEREVLAQFHPDGSNFEASTSYHCFALEMALVATASALGAEARSGYAGSFSRDYVERLGAAVRFASATAGLAGEIPQIGDNDSGRFVKTGAEYVKVCEAEAVSRWANVPVQAAARGGEYWIEGARRAAQLKDMWLALTGSSTERLVSPEAFIVRMLSRGRYLKEPELKPALRAVNTCGWQELTKRRTAVPGEQQRSYTLRADVLRLDEGVEQFAFPGFGIYVMRSDRIVLIFRCGSIGQGGIGGHAHDDQLSLDLWMDGAHVLTDPGTYLYTPLPERRNEYRSAKAHNGPRPLGVNVDLIGGGLFSMRRAKEGTCIFFEGLRVAGEVSWPGVAACRTVEITSDAVLIRDWIEGEFVGWEEQSPVAASRAYGWRDRECMPRLKDVSQ